MKHHELKCNVIFFQDLVDYRKRHDVRFNDRNFEVGDTVTFHEGQQELTGFKPTDKTVTCKISYIDDYGLQEGYVCLSLERMGLLDAFESDIPEFLKEQG